MAEEPSSPAPLGEITHGPSKFEEFLDKNQKKLILAILAVIVAISAYIVISGMKESEDNSAGEALSGAGNTESSTYDIAALRDVMESYRESPASGSAALLLAEEQWKDGRKEESVETLRTFLTDKPGHAARPSALYALASHLLALGKRNEAMESFQQVIDDPEAKYLAPFALLTLGDLEKADGNEEAARSHYEQARDGYPNNSLSLKQFANARIALLGVQPPTLIAPPAVPETPPVPSPGPTIPNTAFPELIPTTPAPIPPAPTPTPTPETTPPATDETGKDSAPETETDTPAAEENDAADAAGEADKNTPEENE